MKILVPRTIWVAITARVFNTEELTLVAVVAVIERDVAFLVADRL